MYKMEYNYNYNFKDHKKSLVIHMYIHFLNQMKWCAF